MVPNIALWIYSFQQKLNKKLLYAATELSWVKKKKTGFSSYSKREAVLFGCMTQINCAREPMCVSVRALCCYMCARQCCVSPRSLTHESGGSSNSKSCPRCWNQTHSATQRDAQFTYDPPWKLTTKVRLGCYSSEDPHNTLLNIFPTTRHTRVECFSYLSSLLLQ